MAGPIPSLAPGKSSRTAAAMTWAAECRIVSSGSRAPASSSSSARDRISSLSIAMVRARVTQTRARLETELLPHALGFVLDIGLVQEAKRLQAAIAIAPALDVRQVLRARQCGAEADALINQCRVHR